MCIEVPETHRCTKIYIFVSLPCRKSMFWLIDKPLDHPADSYRRLVI